MHLKNNSIEAIQRFLAFGHPNFFSPILVICGIRLKFWSTAHLKCFKYPYWYLLFLAQIWLFWLQRGQFWYLKCQFFFHGSSLLWKWGLSSEAQVIWSVLSTRTDICFFDPNLTILVAAGPISVLKVPNFFSRILIIIEIRLKFWSTGHLTLSNMSKLIPHCSNWWKIVFWPW